MALDIAEKIFLFWIAGSDDNHYLNNLCRAWNDALDNFEYVPLNLEAGEHPGDSILEQLNGDDPSSFDYYICSGAGLKARIEEFIEMQSIPTQQVVLETI